jgi:DNA-binding MarR family transcriptional regulator
MDSLLATLELNFFITKYYEMKDRDGRKASVYALNHGLCAKYSIGFGRPSGKREYRLYYVERIFDYTPILKKYIEVNQELKCSNCGVVHGLDKLESIKLFEMMCPSCRQGRCVISNLFRKYEAVLRQIDEERLLPSTELEILNVLYTERRDLFAAEIAEELDCSFQLIGKRGKIMAERGLVDRAKNDRNRRVFSLTDRAFGEYFKGNKERRLDVNDD